MGENKAFSLKSDVLTGCQLLVTSDSRVNTGKFYFSALAIIFVSHKKENSYDLRFLKPGFPLIQNLMIKKCTQFGNILYSHSRHSNVLYIKCLS